MPYIRPKKRKKKRGDQIVAVPGFSIVRNFSYLNVRQPEAKVQTPPFCPPIVIYVI